MITYVNTVLVSNLNSNNVLSAAPAAASGQNTPSADAGKFIVMTLDEAKASNDSTSTFPYLTSTNADKYNTIKIGIVTNQNAPKVDYSTGAVTYQPIVKWSNAITVNSVKNYANLAYTADTEDAVTIDFTSIDANVLSNFAIGGKRIIIRLTFKDLPTRFRNWTESYEYVTKAADLDDATDIADYKELIATDIVNLINKQYKRARVTAAVADDTKVVLTAMKYDDDNTVDSINWANKVRFNANIYYTDPAAEGWESTNKHFPTGVTIAKVPGKTYAASAKLVRDRESQAMGYQGILNRGEGTWPIIKPEMQTVLSNHYDAITLEFERPYRSADDLFRKTKETVEIYAITSTLSGLDAILKAFIG